MAAPLPERIGHYQIVRALGKGGMGAVYLAQDAAIERLVAIKVLREGVDSPEIRERFAREARSAGRLRHPNIVTIFHVGVGEEDSQPYIVMEYIPGETLAEIVKQRLPLTITRKLRIIEELCRGLAHAHKSGVVHRDVKPANVLVDSEGAVKILDFGIARVDEQEMTRMGMMMGTPHYMSPEQVSPGTADHRSDVFSVGLVLYELLTYKRAFPGDMFAVLHAIVNNEPEPIESLVPGIDPDLVGILRRSLQKSPELRYQEMGAMRTELSRLRQRLSAGADESGDEGPLPAASDGPPTVDTPASPALASASIAQHLNMAKQLFDAREYGRAVEECELTLALDPDNRTAINLRSRATHELDAVAARKLLATARGALSAGHLSAAVESLGRVEALRLMGDTAIEIGEELSGLRRNVDLARQRIERTRASVQAARSHLRDGELDLAMEALDAADAADDPSVRSLRGEVTAALALREQQKAKARGSRWDQRTDETLVITPPPSATPVAAEVPASIEPPATPIEPAVTPIEPAVTPIEPAVIPIEVSATPIEIAETPIEPPAVPVEPPPVTPAEPAVALEPAPELEAIPLELQETVLPTPTPISRPTPILPATPISPPTPVPAASPLLEATLPDVEPATPQPTPIETPRPTPTPRATPIETPRPVPIEPPTRSAQPSAPPPAPVVTPAPARAVTPPPEPHVVATPAPQARTAFESPVRRAAAPTRPAWVVPSGIAAAIIVLAAIAWTMSGSDNEGTQAQLTPVASTVPPATSTVPPATSTVPAVTTAPATTTALPTTSVQPTTVKATTTVPATTTARGTASVRATTSIQSFSGMVRPSQALGTAPQGRSALGATSSVPLSTIAPTTSVAPTPSTVPAVVATPPRGTAPTVDQDRAAILAVMQRYADGIRSMNMGAIREIYPTSPTFDFKDARAIEIELSNVQIALDGARATVTCIRTMRQTVKAGNAQASRVNMTFQLERRAPGWLIAGSRAEVVR